MVTMNYLRLKRCFIIKGVLKNFSKFTGKHLCQSLFSNKVAGLRPATLFKKRLWRRCFPVNFAKFLRAPFIVKHLRWLLLSLQRLSLGLVIRRRSAKKMSLKISKNSQEIGKCPLSIIVASLSMPPENGPLMVRKYIIFVEPLLYLLVLLHRVSVRNHSCSKVLIKSTAQTEKL